MSQFATVPSYLMQPEFWTVVIVTICERVWSRPWPG